jgi:predicted nucleic acid-binding protein
MTVVVSDTSPLSYLVEINCGHLLPTLYGRVLIPRALLQELSNPRDTGKRAHLADTRSRMACDS